MQQTSRSPKTEQAYEARVLGLLARLGRGEHQASMNELVTFLIGSKPGWSKSTWQQYKAATMYYLAAHREHGWEAALSRLELETVEGCRSRTTKTSGRRMKQVSDDNFRAVLGEIKQLGGKYAEHLTVWLRLGALFGLRPHEWCHADIVNKDPEGHVGSFLKVRNSKHSNGRGNGEWRHIDIGEAGANNVKAAAKFIIKMRKIVAQGDYERTYDGSRRLLYRANKNVFGASGKWLQLYSPRHKFSSIAKHSLSLAHVAALMGHSTDKTATMHYGKKRYGKGGLRVKPIEGEVATVKSVYRGHPDMQVIPDIKRRS